jgi:class 3 adenylate cyclase
MSKSFNSEYKFMTKNRKFVSINLGISSAFILIIMFTSIALSTLSYLTIKNAMRSDLQKKMHDVVIVGILSINGNDHIKIKDQSWLSSDEYKHFFKTLTYIKDNVIDVKNVYTMNINEKGKYVFIVDSEKDEKSRASIGDVYDGELTIEMKNVFEKKDKIYIEKNFTKDKWGTWISGYAPIFTSDKQFAGIFGIDISAQTVIDYETRALMIIVIITVCVIIAGIVLAMFLSNKITSPLSQLEKDIGRIQNFLFDDQLDLKTIFKEIKNIDNTVDNVKASLRSFQKYVPSDLVRQLITLKKEAVLGGEKKVLTLYFSDIKDSTTFAESLKPEDLIKVLDKYFEGMTGTLINHKATIDKYIGDCIMAFWNAPTDIENHALIACQAALATKQFLRQFNEDLEKKGIMKLSTRIGMNTGEVIVGNIGYEKRFNYTAIGDTVNVASRMEGLNKYYGTEILITESTYNEVKDAMAARIIDRVIVKGKTKGILIYELISSIDNSGRNVMKLIEHFNAAMENYFSMKWSDAIKLFNEILEVKPKDMPSSIIKDRCLNYLKNPPSSGWDGIYIQKDK